MYREMLREQRMLRERVEELARTSREEVRLKRRDRRRPTPDSARPSTTELGGTATAKARGPAARTLGNQDARAGEAARRSTTTSSPRRGAAAGAVTAHC